MRRRSARDQARSAAGAHLGHDVAGGRPARYAGVQRPPCRDYGWRARAVQVAATTALLVGSGFSVQLETSGTQAIQVNSLTSVTVSPKCGLPGGRSVLGEALGRANEWARLRTSKTC